MSENTADNSARKGDVAKEEEATLAFWQKEKIFEKTLEKPAPKGDFVFYDGPPFATGLPHPGSLLSSIIKDLVGRYKTMRGYHVRRRWGWDCHGLPIESIVEKELGLRSKKEIEEIGVEKFNEAAKASVLRYAREWKKYVDRVGRWVEFDSAYKTMDNSYMESVWFALKKIWEDGLLYEGRKVLLYCPHCETPLAKAEIAMDNSYRDVTEESVTMKFKVKDPEKHGLSENTHLLAWTTTPWTLPGNVALAVGENIDYVLNDDNLIFAKSRMEDISGISHTVKKEMKGSELVGIEYEPLYEIPAVKNSGKKAWYVASADFVSTEDGTGIVHTAVIYGEDDYNLGIAIDLPMVPMLDASGHFNDDAPEFLRGKYFKDAGELILDDLEEKGLVFERKNFTHSYPHCYRCDTPLIYNALSSWFINIQKVKQKLIDLNEKIHWHPEHLKHGRFLNIVEDAPDWTISRNRYWASPLPIWKCKECTKTTVVGSLEELREKSYSSGNTYFAIRHGESKSNVEHYVDSGSDTDNHLTEDGKEGVRKAAEELKDKNIDMVFSSTVLRAKETAEIVSKELGVDVVYDDRVNEKDFGDYDRKSEGEYASFFKNVREKFEKPCPNGENRNDLRKRMGEFIYEVDSKYKDKNILIVSHGTPLHILRGVALGWDADRISEDTNYFENSEWREIEFYRFPHNSVFELDMHRPYIDAIKLTCECGGEMERIPEVIDCWAESGSMPFAEYHYPFENKEVFEKRFPGDFVAEYIAQTRTWFYYMHAMAALVFDDIAFKNVVVTGTILAEDGDKLSKSKGNYTDPLENFNKFGADALRYYLMTSVVMQAEDLKFTDDDLKEVHNRLINIVRNVYAFYKTYGEKESSGEAHKNSDHVLDVWIVSRLNELITEMTRELDAYNTVRAGRPIRDFVTDFSTWYLRRSRERFKGDDAEDKKRAADTTRFVLLEFSKVIAPFMPFLAEHIYQGCGGKLKSIHLEEWPVAGEIDTAVIEKMAEARDVVSRALERRATGGIKIRQPLASLTVKGAPAIRSDKALVALIADEVNVKEVLFDDSIAEDIELDTTLTEELKAEGNLRELIRHIQGLRKDEGLSPSDTVQLVVGTDRAGEALIKKFEDDIKKATLVEVIELKTSDEGKTVSVDGMKFTLAIT